MNMKANETADYTEKSVSGGDADSTPRGLPLSAFCCIPLSQPPLACVNWP
jgi:hypothetical protein